MCDDGASPSSTSTLPRPKSASRIATRWPQPGQRNGEVDGDVRLADAAFAAGDGDADGRRVDRRAVWSSCRALRASRRRAAPRRGAPASRGAGRPARAARCRGTRPAALTSRSTDGQRRQRLRLVELREDEPIQRRRRRSSAMSRATSRAVLPAGTTRCVRTPRALPKTATTPRARAVTRRTAGGVDEHRPAEPDTSARSRSSRRCAPP